MTTRTEQAENIIYGLLAEQQILTLSEIKQAVPQGLPATFAVWNLKKRGDLFPLGGGRYRGRLAVRARNLGVESYLMLKRIQAEWPNVSDDTAFEGARLISRIER